MAEVPQLSYFAPGEVVITFEHNIPPDDREALVGRLKAHPILQGEFGYRSMLNAEKEGPPLSDSISSDHVSRLESSDGLRSALSRLTPEAIHTIAPVDDRHYLSFVFLRSEKNEFLNNDLALAYLTSELTYQSKQRSGADASGDIQLMTVMPNWFFSGTPGPLTDGGPGARPVPPLAVQRGQTILPTDYMYNPCKFPSALMQLTETNGKLEQAFSSSGANNTTVFILDAVPVVQQLEAAYTAWGSSGINPLLERLLAPPCTNAPLTYETARMKFHYYDTTADPVFHERQTVHHDYLMTDHGLFIAGIVDCLAPQTDIDLVEVLNQYGVGTFKSLIWGLDHVLNAVRDQGISRFLVNCSLMMAMPHDQLLAAAQNDQIISFYSRSASLVNITETIHRLFDGIMIQSGGAIIVAAAGNDSELPDLEVPARYPAAFDSVIGVGALTKTGEIARYSNRADNPTAAGFLAFGGDANYREASSTEGILSVYSAPTYPEGAPNTSGWACWAGTSFACAVACGTLARLYNQGLNAASAQQLLQDVSLEDQTTSAHYIPVGQGPF
jgi:hypothetical protein